MPNKSRILYIMQILNEETDEEHPIIITEIIDKLSAMGIAVTRKTVVEDIEQLKEFGLDVICIKSTQNRYFIGERNFELPELKLLVDAVESSHFITRKKSKVLIEKLSKLTNKHQAAMLDRQVYVASRIKSENEAVYFIIDLLHTAINGQNQIEFKYYEYNEKKKKTLKHRGKIYKFSPYALTWNADQYYVLGFSESHGKIVKFRVDRIFKPKITDNQAAPKPTGFDVAEFSKSVFNMYDGEEQEVELLCDAKLMKVVVDKFGKDINTAAVDKNTFIATVKVSTSPTFYGWVFGFSGQMKILSPDCVKEEYINLAKNVCCE